MTDTRSVLFGIDTTEGIVAVEAGESEAVVYIRQGDKVTTQKEKFIPWLLMKDNSSVPGGGYCKELDGGDFRYLITFESWQAWNAGRSELRNKGIEQFSYPSPEKQFLISSGKTLFKGLTLDDIYRMQIDIETIGNSLSPENGKIILISITDNKGFETVLEGTEEEMLTSLIAIVKDRNPDVLEGHNFFGFDLPFIDVRAKKHNILMALGRNETGINFANERSFPVGGFSRPYTPAHIYGRHIIDTLHAVMRFDVGKGQLERYGLKYVAEVLGLAEPERVYIPGNEISGMWKTDPERLKIYAVQDVRETRSLAALVCPSSFYQTQMSPETYQSAAVSGNGEKINSILIREYLRQGCGIPAQKEPRAVPGGYTEIRKTGVLKHIVKCDVESLYPSIMLSFGIKPSSDTLNIFLPALKELTIRRIDAKTKAKTGEVSERQYWDGLQSSFKILINSFYGYLGAQLNFNDFDAAEDITTKGQIIVKQIADSIEREGGDVIEIDTDGVYFQPPDEVVSLEDEEEFVLKIGKDLPSGIRLAHDGRYAAMISLKIKNYILVDYNQRRILHGSSMRSRADEAFGKKFLSDAVDLLISGESNKAGDLYMDIAKKITNGELDAEDFTRRERITSKTFSSTQKKRIAAAAKGIKVGEYVSVYEKENGELGLLENYANDENKDYLLSKLYKFAQRLREAFGEDFDSIFPKPGAKAKLKQAGQKNLDLF